MPDVEVRYVKAFRLYQGDHSMYTCHNKTLKPQLKGNICRERLYVSHSGRRRVRNMHKREK